MCMFEGERERDKRQKYRDRDTHRENIIKNSFCKLIHTHTHTNTCAMDMVTILFPISLLFVLLPIPYHKCQNSWTETGCRRTQTRDTKYCKSLVSSSRSPVDRPWQGMSKNGKSCLL